jgi:hypothetical protein
MAVRWRQEVQCPRHPGMVPLPLSSWPRQRPARASRNADGPGLEARRWPGQSDLQASAPPQRLARVAGVNPALVGQGSTPARRELIADHPALVGPPARGATEPWTAQLLRGETVGPRQRPDHRGLRGAIGAAVSGLPWWAWLQRLWPASERVCRAVAAEWSGSFVRERGWSPAVHRGTVEIAREVEHGESGLPCDRPGSVAIPTAIGLARLFAPLALFRSEGPVAAHEPPRRTASEIPRGESRALASA